MGIVKNNNLLNVVYSSGVTYLAQKNITYFWNFIIFVLVLLCILLLTCMLFVMFYVRNIDLTFNNVEYLMFVFNVYGMFFFFCSYIYGCKSLYCRVVVMLIVMIVIAFFLSNFYSKLINELKLDIKFIEDEKFKYSDYNFLILELEKCLDNVGLNLKHNYGYNQSLHYHLGDYCRFIHHCVFGLIIEKELFHKR